MWNLQPGMSMQKCISCCLTRDKNVEEWITNLERDAGHQPRWKNNKCMCKCENCDTQTQQKTHQRDGDGSCEEDGFCWLSVSKTMAERIVVANFERQLHENDGFFVHSQGSKSPGMKDKMVNQWQRVVCTIFCIIDVHCTMSFEN